MIKPNTILIYKNFAAHRGVSHIGLGVAAMKNAEMLNAHVGPTLVVAARHNIDIVKAIEEHQAHGRKLTDVIISALWISTRDLRAMATRYPHIDFAIVSHSNVGFLQADPNAFRLIREGLKLSKELPNFHVAGNCAKFVNWLIEAYGTKAITLPNMYRTNTPAKPWRGNSIRIGSFGAVRPQKNLLSAAAAALAISKILNKPVEFFYNSGRDEGGSGTIANAIYQMGVNIPNFKVERFSWATHDNFMKIVSTMDLLLQLSYTESFNMVTADGINCGVPSAVSRAIYWAPKSWMANADDVLDIARTGIKLLENSRQRRKGLVALKGHNAKALKQWGAYLEK